MEAVLRPVVTGAVCAEPPAMTVRGTSVDTSVTLSAADFGVQPCNSTPEAKSITVTNYSPQSIVIESATLPAGVPLPDGGARKAKLRMEVQGAILTVSPTVLDFVSNGWLTDQKSFTVENTGNAAITVDYDFVRTKGDAAWYPDRTPDTVEPGKTVKMEMGFRPTGIGPYEATLTPRRQSGAIACTPMPVATARGSRR